MKNKIIVLDDTGIVKTKEKDKTTYSRHILLKSDKNIYRISINYDYKDLKCAKLYILNSDNKLTLITNRDINDFIKSHEDTVEDIFKNVIEYFQNLIIEMNK